MNRRDFMKTTVVASATAALARPGEAKTVAPSDRLAIGVIGCGARAHEHLQNLVEMPGEVVAATPTGPGRTGEVAPGGRATIVQDTHGSGDARRGRRFHRYAGSLAQDDGVEALAAKKGHLSREADELLDEDNLGILDAVAQRPHRADREPEREQRT
jgi:hypothetical protein